MVLVDCSLVQAKPPREPKKDQEVMHGLGFRIPMHLVAHLAHTDGQAVCLHAESLPMNKDVVGSQYHRCSAMFCRPTSSMQAKDTTEPKQKEAACGETVLGS